MGVLNFVAILNIGYIISNAREKRASLNVLLTAGVLSRSLSLSLVCSFRERIDNIFLHTTPREKHGGQRMNPTS